MAQLPPVTVLVCAFDYERYVGAALDSALAQDYAGPLEVLVVDDGSTDRTPEILAGYGDRIRVVRQENAGLNAATARGIAEARGDVVALLDADDLWRADKLRRQAALLVERPEVGLVYCDMELIDPDGALVAPSYFRHHGLRPPRGPALGALLRQSLVPAPTIAFRRSLAGHVLPVAEAASFQDWWLALKVAEVAELDWVDEPLVSYRLHGDNMSSGAEGEQRVRNVRADIRFRRWMLANLDLRSVAAADLRVGAARLEHDATAVAHCTGGTAAAELTAGDEERLASARALTRARGAGDRRDAALSALAAVAAAPTERAARRELAELLDQLEAEEAAAAPAVSVIVCAYNYERYVGEAIESALAQDHPSFEVIVVDDGSTDGTPDVIARYGDAVRAIRRPNGGLNAATDTGVAAARGAYITFLDADDCWPIDRLSRLAAVLDARPEVGVVYGDMDIVDADGAQIAPSFRAQYGIPPVSGRVLGRLLRNNAVSAGSMMVRASLRDRFHPIPADAAHQDWWIVTAVAGVAEVAAIDAVVNHYRQHGDNMNLGASGEHLLGLYRHELPFRRRLLTTTDPALVALGDLVAALEVHDRLVERLAAADRETAAPSDRGAALAAMEAASEALDRADLEAAGAWLVRAAAHDPADAEPRSLLSQLLPVIAAAYSAGTPTAPASAVTVPMRAVPG